MLRLNPWLHLNPRKKIGREFTPSKSSITEEISHHPKDKFLLPPAAWVSPRKGQFDYQDQMWEFVFHGGGLTFFDNQSPKSDVSVEFSRDGHVALTSWTFRCYLETVTHRRGEPMYRNILYQLEDLLDQLVKLGYLIPVTPILIYDDQAFILAED